MNQTLTDCARDTLACLRFFSRLAIPRQSFEGDVHAAPDLGKSARMLPLAGAVLGGLSALALWVINLAGLPPALAAALMLAFSLWLTGAMHEDGLADVADGFGGGATRDRKLDIMKDSRLGTYGVCALALSLFARVIAVAALLETSGIGGAMAALLVCGAVSRTASLLPLALLPPARSEGLGKAAGAPGQEGLILAALICAGLALLLPLAGIGFGRAMFAMIVACLPVLALVRLARAQIGGHTGDVAGAAQQLAEIGFLCALLFGSGLA